METDTNYSGMPGEYPYERERALHERERLEYELTVRQEPKQARMCGVGADRRPIDPPPIIQLRVIDPHTRQPPSSAHPDADDGDPNYVQSFLQNPYYFMFASLAKPDDDAELHWLKDGKTRCTTGSVVSSLYHLKDTENRNEDAGFFVFPDLSVRTEGSYRLKLSLFEVVGNTVRHCKSIYSAPFYVYTAKKFPGMEESTPLSCSLADQGIKIRIRKDIRVRKRPITALATPVDGDNPDDDPDEEPNSAGPSSSSSAIVPASSTGKRARHGTLSTNGPPVVLGPPSAGARGPGDMTTPTSTAPTSLVGLPAWPSTTVDPMLGVASAPGGVELAAAPHGAPSPRGTSGAIPPQTGATYEPSRLGASGVPPPPGAHIMNTHQTGVSFEPRQSAVPSSTQRSHHLQSLSSSYPSATIHSISPSDPVPATPVYDAPGPRMSYEAPRPPYESSRSSYEQNSRTTYEGSRTGYEHPQPRGSYENSRSGYDAQSQRPSYGASYDAPPPGASHSYQDTPPNVSYSNASSTYSGPQQSLPSPTHHYPQQASSQQPPHHTHQPPYPSSTTRSQSQFGAPAQPNNYGPPSAYPSTQGRYDYSPAQQPHYSGNGGENAYYDNAASQPSPSSHAPPHNTHAHQQPPPSSFYGGGQPNSAPPSSSSTTSPWGAPPPGPPHTHPHSQSYSSSSPYEYNHPSQSYSGSSTNGYYPSSTPSSHAASSAARVASPAAGHSSSSSTAAAAASTTSRYSAPQQQQPPYSGASEGGYARSAPFSAAYNLPPPGPPPPPSSSSSLANNAGTPHHEWTPSTSGWSAGAGTSVGVSQHHQHQHHQHQQHHPQQQQQPQEMIHLAPLRHTGTGAPGPSSSSSSSPSSPSLPSVVSAAGAGAAYPGMIHLSRAPFEQEAAPGLRGMPPGVVGGVGVGVGVGVPGKKNVLSIGSIISEGG
ncbi:velvet factor-domain-containing protein [Phlebopus sp. FC_14]|nr:velvet factor-domain-containing protein [Phlebopus sp. FC_14]